MVMDVLQVELVPMVANENVNVTELPPAFHEFFAIEEQA
jgi:hypothetical protein